MRIKSIILNNFRSFKKRRFEFNNKTVIIGPNASGKSNLLEAIYLLATGHSVRALRDIELINSKEDFATIAAEVRVDGDQKNLLLQIAKSDGGRGLKRFKVNGVGRNLVNFAGNLLAVIFEPEDIQLVLGSPDLRRNYLNRLLSLVSRNYHQAVISYDHVRRRRNKVLESIREGRSGGSDLEFWDGKILELSPSVYQLREEFFRYLNQGQAGIFFNYRKNVIDGERLSRYREREIASGTTLIGPHRDDFTFEANNPEGHLTARRDLSVFGSRGEQRMAVFTLKMLEISFLEKSSRHKPILLLDDIFSELDRPHRGEIWEQLGNYQVILTTTDEELLGPPALKNSDIQYLDGKLY